jgi:spore coat protein CotH
MRSMIFALVVALFACDDTTEHPRDAGTEGDSEVEIDPTDEIFDPEHLLEIQIDLAPSDWDLIRAQHHDFFGVMIDDCHAGAPESPYEYVRATLTVDGEAIDDVAVRSKGFLGSINLARPSLKISFDEHLPDRRFQGLRRMTLNNNQQDPSQVDACLAYMVFRAAGVPAPRCNFARVTVNGVDLGIFSHVESIKRPFLGRHFDSNDGNLYEGALADFRPVWVDNYEGKAGNDDDRSDLQAMVEALRLPDDELLGALEQILDTDAFLTFWAVEVLVGHWDGFNGNRNNHYLYRDPESELFHFIPWGTDACFGEENPFVAFDPPASVWANNQLSSRLYNHPEVRHRYQDRLRSLLDTVWDEEALLAEIDRIEAQISPHLRIPSELFTSDLEKVRDFVEGRRELLEADLASDPAWNFPLQEDFCLESVGTITGTFSSLYGPFPSANPFATGSGALEISYRGEVVSFSRMGASAGPDEDPMHPRIGVMLVGLRADNTLLIPYLLIEPELYAAPATLEVDAYSVFGLLLGSALMGEPQLLAFTRGTLTLEAAGEDGDPVSGSFELEIIGQRQAE